MEDEGRDVFTAVPVEYAVAVERYLNALRLSPASVRVYRIALATWAWALVETPLPSGTHRRGAEPPTVPLAALDAPHTPERLRTAATNRLDRAGSRTLRRELSILRGAVTWWRSQGWIEENPVEGLDAPAPAKYVDGPDIDRVAAVLRLRAPLREQALWHVLYESGAPVQRVLALCVPELDLARHRSYWSPGLRWGSASSHLLDLLTLGRFQGPVFVSRSRLSHGSAAERCPVTGRGRLSYRRAAELFTTATRDLDPQGRGWTLRDLRRTHASVSSR